jgi:hypothetical protein
MAKKCAFCTRPADSPEHVFSQWMLDLLPPNERYVCNERLFSRDEYIQYQRRKIKIVAKVVCTPCNNNWMSNLEGRLKPILQDVFLNELPTTFGHTDLATIAAFAFKTTVLANHKDLKSTPFFSAAERFRFRRQLRIPDGVQVWMASRRETIAGKYHGFWKSAQGKSEKYFGYGFANYICTWNFQNVVLQIVATKWQDKRRRNTVPPFAFPEDDYWKQASVLIWPLPPTAIQWPPIFYLGNSTLFKFRDRWDTIRIRLR